MIPVVHSKHHQAQAGNVLFIILIAMVLIGVLTAAIQFTNRSDGSNIDQETMIIRASEVQRYASELERAVNYIIESGQSESALRFAHPDAPSDYGDLSADPDTRDQIFASDGGGATYREPPEGVNDGSPWEFFGGTHIPGMGTGRAELVAVLPNVTQDFCERINMLKDQTLYPWDGGTGLASGNGAGDNAGSCVNMGDNGRFVGAFHNTPNTMDESTFEQDTSYSPSVAYPAAQACVTCNEGEIPHFYHVLLVR